MKKRIQIFICLCVLLMSVLLGNRPVQAGAADTDRYDADHPGAIHVRLDDLGTNRKGVSLYCYYVGTPKTEEGMLMGWEPVESFASLNLDLNDLGDTKKHRAAADKLAEFVEEQSGIEAVQRQSTDGEGRASFTDLKQGVYLIVQKNQFAVYGTTQPFLVTIPYMEDGVILYEVETETKGRYPTPTNPPKDPEDPYNPPRNPGKDPGDDPKYYPTPSRPGKSPGSYGGKNYSNYSNTRGMTMVKTLDDNPVAFWGGIFLMAGAVIGGLVYRRRR